MRKNSVVFIFFLIVGVMMYSQTIDVLTYNIRYDNPKDSINNWNNRKDFLISQLNFYAPGIFGTQEGLSYQLEDIKDGVQGYSYIGHGREDGKLAGEFSAIFYNTAKFKVLEESTFWLSKTPNIPSKGWDASIERVCTYGLFRVLNGKSKFWVFNTHFDHVGEEARKESIGLILDKINLINKEGYPVILMGDLNLEPNHSSIQFLSNEMEDVQLLAGKKAFGPQGTFNGFRFSEPVIRRIDYIFVSKGGFEVLKYGILSDSKDCSYPSDHLPVLSRLKIQ